MYSINLGGIKMTYTKLKLGGNWIYYFLLFSSRGRASVIVQFMESVGHNTKLSVSIDDDLHQLSIVNNVVIDRSITGSSCRRSRRVRT